MSPNSGSRALKSRFASCLDAVRTFVAGISSKDLTPRQVSVLSALAGGHHLKCHRLLDGTKIHRLHDASGKAVTTVAARDVATLEARGLVACNMKFPVAAYLLTERGARRVASHAGRIAEPVQARLPSATDLPR